MQRMGLVIADRPASGADEDRRSNVDGLFAGQPDDADPALTRRSGNRADRVTGIHGGSFGSRNRSPGQEVPVRDDLLGNREYVVRQPRSEEHTSELQSRLHLVCRLLLEKKKKT